MLQLVVIQLEVPLPEINDKLKHIGHTNGDSDATAATTTSSKTKEKD